MTRKSVNCRSIGPGGAAGAPDSAAVSVSGASGGEIAGRLGWWWRTGRAKQKEDSGVSENKKGVRPGTWRSG